MKIGSFVYLAYRNIDKHKEDKELHDLKHEIIIWNRTLQGLSNFSREEAVVKEIIGMKINELRDEYEDKLVEKGRSSSIGNILGKGALFAVPTIADCLVK